MGKNKPRKTLAQKKKAQARKEATQHKTNTIVSCNKTSPEKKWYTGKNIALVGAAVATILGGIYLNKKGATQPSEKHTEQVVHLAEKMSPDDLRKFIEDFTLDIPEVGHIEKQVIPEKPKKIIFYIGQTHYPILGNIIQRNDEIDDIRSVQEDIYTIIKHLNIKTVFNEGQDQSHFNYMNHHGADKWYQDQNQRRITHQSEKEKKLLKDIQTQIISQIKVVNFRIEKLLPRNLQVVSKFTILPDFHGPFIHNNAERFKEQISQFIQESHKIQLINSHLTIHTSNHRDIHTVQRIKAILNSLWKSLEVMKRVQNNRQTIIKDDVLYWGATKLFFENKIKLLPAAEEGFAEEIYKKHKLNNDYHADYLTEGRENHLIECINKYGNDYQKTITVFGVAHQMKNNIEEWNEQNPDRQCALIYISPKSIPLKFNRKKVLELLLTKEPNPEVFIKRPLQFTYRFDKEKVQIHDILFTLGDSSPKQNNIWFMIKIAKKIYGPNHNWKEIEQKYIQK